MTRFDVDKTTKAEDDPVFAPESIPWSLVPTRRADRHDWQNDIDDMLGPYPEWTVETFHDLGLNDDEIARYFGTDPHRVKRLSDGGERPGRSRSLREFAQQMRAKLFGGNTA